MPKIKDGGSAFPGQAYGADGLPMTEAETGMTLRDWFAGQALGFLAPLVTNRSDEKVVAAQAYIIADAMLVEREKGGDA